MMMTTALALLGECPGCFSPVVEKQPGRTVTIFLELTNLTPSGTNPLREKSMAARLQVALFATYWTWCGSSSHPFGAESWEELLRHAKSISSKFGRYPPRFC